jgi:hypothetical protein
MMKRVFVMIIVAVMSGSLAGGAIPTLSIYDIQYTTQPDGSSNYDAQQVNCKGGIVIHKWGGGRQRVVLYDPNNPTGWGGILVKGATSTTPFDTVNLGDWVALDSITIYEWNNKSRGNTILYLDSSSVVCILSTGNSLPEPLVVDVNDVAVIYDPVYQTCSVTDHRADKYEGMYIQVRNITVGDVNVGKALDNYSLYSDGDPNIYCWASDYMNKDNSSGLTHLPVVQTGQHFCSVSGILEQYTDTANGWDYYQILTTKNDDLQITQQGDLDGDCDVDFLDLAILSRYWLVGTK